MSQPPVARAVGVRDVAVRAGVSTQTVSRVLNAHPHIRPETRQRVLDAIEALGYRVNNAARALGTSVTRTIGIIASDASLYGPSVGIAALERAARAAGRWVTTAYADAADEDSVLAAAAHLREQGVDAIAVVAAHTGSFAALVRHGGVAIVALHGDAAAHRQGAALAVAHLAELGHERIALLAGPDDWTEAVARERGFDDGLAARGLVRAGRWRGDWTASAGAAAADEIAGLLGAPGAPTAVFASNDQMALGLVAGLRRAGVDVPRQLSVVGFDDNPDAAFYTPALTTVRLDVEAEARRCIAALLGSADAEASAPAAPVLVVRESVGPPDA
ncbi:LacI family DNA-binding transcriptional regulator [Microbacterium sp. NPDC078428]|uniref:LacI family DNA-binding transcriptional regulator n=1 Tax=Microbacterium sp. NPDC078428 TaxID=3364190 RepID=UPI0037CA4F3F